MTDKEDYFPRGGKKPSTKFFKQSSNFLGAPEKTEKKRKAKKKSEEDDGYLSDEAVKNIDQSHRNCSVWLKYSIVKDGFLILGRVRQTQDTRIYVSLPCRLIGVVMACHISESYNKLLEAYVNDQIDKMKDLQQMFRPGQYVALRVLEVAVNHLMLSMMPNHVNSGKMQADLHKGAVLQAAVSSVEDHGYVMDIGIPNVTAFLPKTAANPEIDLDTGMVTWCSIKSIAASPESCLVSLTSELSALQKAFQRNSSSTLLPANAVNFTVDKPLGNGIEGTIFEDRVAYIQRQHVDKVNGKKPALGQKIRARVLYVLPTTTTPFLTMRNIFETTYPDMEQEQKFQEGDIVDEAQVIKIAGRTIYLKLGEDSIGLLSLRRIQVDEDLQDEDVVAKSYPLGSTHRVRVLRYNMCDFSYSVTNERHVLEERYFSLEQLRPGQLVDATVTSVAAAHVILRVGRVIGYVPHSHMTDAGIVVDPKKASTSQLSKKKFKVGQEVKARVLSLNLGRRSLFLTLKPTLLDPELQPLTEYKDARVGASYPGVVALIKEHLVVSFFNNVQAFISPRFVSADRPDNLNDAFHLGQIVRCTILRVDVEKTKMSGSLTTAPFTPSEHREKSVKRKKSNVDPSSTKSKQDDDLPKKKKRALEDVGQNTDAHDTAIKKKKVKNDDTNQVDSDVVVKKCKKKKKEVIETEKDFIENEEGVETVELNSKRKKKKKLEKRELSKANSESNEDTEHNKKSKRNNTEADHTEQNFTEITPSTEESDAIETDFHEDSDSVLTPEDLGLIDMSDCETLKQYKKRVVSLLKAIKNRTNRIDTVEKKIMNIENKGLTPRNKKYHTAMHMEKLVIQLRITKLLAALKAGQDKLKEFGFENNTDYKKKNKVKKIPPNTDVESETVNNSSNSQESEKVIQNVSKTEEKKIKSKLKDIKVVEELKPALEVPSAKDFWSTDADIVMNTAPEKESSDSDDEQEQEKPKKKRKKLSGAEKVAKAREEEERVRELERRAADGEGQPRSSEQFERALLARPAASQLWIAYMAFHLQATEVEKARGVARRALTAIPFREEGERLNVWLALLNLEHRFGTEESQRKTLEEALQMNEPYEVHSSLLDVYVDTGKVQELGALVELMARRYRRQPAVYPRCAAALYRAGLTARARQLMQKGVAALDKKDHVSLLVSFAQLERQAGERERAEALFEQVLAVYPQRVDVCAQYADMLANGRHLDQLRQLMDRMTSLKLPARKMKILYKKWIEVEEKIGDSEHVESIRQRAAEFIEKAKF